MRNKLSIRIIVVVCLLILLMVSMSGFQYRIGLAHVPNLPFTRNESNKLALEGITERVSVSSDGTEGDGSSIHTSISADGRYVAFTSAADNLVNGDTNGAEDVFVHDRETGKTVRVSVSSEGIEGNNDSTWTAISADGRCVVFASSASNLASGDTNGVWDIFVHDLETGQTERVSVSSDGTGGDNISHRPSISADGRYVAFSSVADNLVSGDNNGVWDVFVHDRETGQTERVSVSSDGIEGNNTSHRPSSISGDGRYVSFSSEADNLVSGDTNEVWDVFVHDRETGQTERVSVSSDGIEGNDSSLEPSISADGRYVAFSSVADNLISEDTKGRGDVFVHDRVTGQTERVSVSSTGTGGNRSSIRPSISADGRFVAFTSAASNLVSGDTNGVRDIFVHDSATGQIDRVSVSSDGIEGNDTSHRLSISADGYHVAFSSDADNLVIGDTNGVADIFVHDQYAMKMIYLPVITR